MYVSHWFLCSNKEFLHSTLFLPHITDCMHCEALPYSSADCQKSLQLCTQMPETSNLFHLKFHIPTFVTGHWKKIIWGITFCATYILSITPIKLQPLTLNTTWNSNLTDRQTLPLNSTLYQNLEHTLHHLNPYVLLCCPWTHWSNFHSHKQNNPT